MSIKERNEISNEYKWSIEDIFPTDDAWENALNKAKEYALKVSTFNGKISKSATDLLEYFSLSDEISILFDSLVNYAQRKLDEDTRNSKYQDMVARLMSVAMELSSNGAFETPEILSMSNDTLNDFYKQQPKLDYINSTLTELEIDRNIYYRKRKNNLYL